MNMYIPLEQSTGTNIETQLLLLFNWVDISRNKYGIPWLLQNFINQMEPFAQSWCQSVHPETRVYRSIVDFNLMVHEIYNKIAKNKPDVNPSIKILLDLMYPI